MLIINASERFRLRSSAPAIAGSWITGKNSGNYIIFKYDQGSRV